MHMKEAKKASNFNEKKNQNQILLQHNAEAKKLILSGIIAPSKFFALNPILQLGQKKKKEKKNIQPTTK